MTDPFPTMKKFVDNLNRLNVSAPKEINTMDPLQGLKNISNVPCQ